MDNVSKNGNPKNIPKRNSRHPKHCNKQRMSLKGLNTTLLKKESLSFEDTLIKPSKTEKWREYRLKTRTETTKGITCV